MAWGKLCVAPASAPSPGVASRTLACVWIQALSPSCQLAVCFGRAALGLPSAQAGREVAKASELTKSETLLSNHRHALGSLPPPKMAPRSFIDTDTITASGCVARKRSATDSAKTGRAEALALLPTPAPVTSFEAGSFK